MNKEWIPVCTGMTKRKNHLVMATSLIDYTSFSVSYILSEIEIFRFAQNDISRSAK